MAELTHEDLEELLMGRASREKGKRGEREFAALCRDEGYDARRSEQYAGGVDSADVVGLPGVHVEVKRQEQLRMEDWMAQSVRDAGEDIPIVAHRKNNCGWLITMRAEDWFAIYREWEAGR